VQIRYALLLLGALPASVFAQQSMVGYSAANAAKERDVEANAINRPSPAVASAHSRELSKETHVAGTPAQARTRDYVIAQMKKWGIDLYGNPCRACGFAWNRTPADTVEAQLVDRIVTCSWRLQRMTLAETSIFDTWRFSADDELEPGESPYSRRFIRRTSEMTALSRYEASLDRSLSRAYALLERRQARRRGEAVAAPLTVLVESGPNSALADSAKPLADNANYEKCQTKPILDVTPETVRLDEQEELPLTRQNARDSAGPTA